MKSIEDIKLCKPVQEILHIKSSARDKLAKNVSKGVEPKPSKIIVNKVKYREIDKVW